MPAATPHPGRGLYYAPFVILGASFLLLAVRQTRSTMLWLLDEDHPVEALTVLFLLLASLTGLRLALTLREHADAGWVWRFYALFSAVLFLVAMEEISWGQRLIGFDTPGSLRAINYQGETTLHNIGPFQGRSEWMRIGFGLGGLVGVWLGSWPALSAVAAPSVLRLWFVVIVAHAAVDAYNDIFPVEARFDYAIQRTSEMIELLISIAAFLYMRLNARRLGARPRLSADLRFGNHPR